MKPYPRHGDIFKETVPKTRGEPAGRPDHTDSGTARPEVHHLGPAVEVAQDILANLEAARLRELTETYRSRHGDDAWEKVINLLPKWRADAVLITGFHGEEALELLPAVLDDAERLEIARAAWNEQYTSVHEFIDLGNIKDSVHLESIVRRRIAAAIAAPVEESTAGQRIQETLLWLCCGDRGKSENLASKLKIAELGNAITPIHDGVTAMRAEIASKDDGWTGLVERRIRSGSNTFDISLRKTEPVRVTWHVTRDMAEALRASAAGNTPTAAETEKIEPRPEAVTENAEPSGRPAPRPGRGAGWLRRLAHQLRFRGSQPEPTRPHAGDDAPDIRRP